MCFRGMVVSFRSMVLIAVSAVVNLPGASPGFAAAGIM